MTDDGVEAALPTQCPICKRKVPVPTGTSPAARGTYPFCSDRCRLIDLGRWLDGAYQIPVKDDDDDEERERPPGTIGDR